MWLYAFYILSKIFKFYNYQYTILSKGILLVFVLNWYVYDTLLQRDESMGYTWIWFLLRAAEGISFPLLVSSIKKTHQNTYILLLFTW